MGQPSYSIEEVYSLFNEIDGYFWEDKGQLNVNKKHKSIDDNCHSWCDSGEGVCHDYFKLASCGVNYLLYNLKDKFDSKYDKLAEYAILWLSYKLNQKPKYSTIELNDFYTNYIEKNDNYNYKINDDDDDNNMTYKEIIDRKKDLMNMNIKEISKFNGPFSILCILYNEINKNNLDCKKCSEDANKFVQKYKELNKNSNIEDSSYNKMLSRLSDDYNNLKKIYDNKCTNFPPLPKIEPKEISVENSGKGDKQILGETSEATSSSSSILKTVIPGLSTFFVIPVFLGVAYKYSLFGIDKLFQRQYIRKELKKIKKKMKLNI